MEKASYLLINNNEKVYKISKKVGYQNVPYFIKVSKKYYGNTPQEFRDTRNIN
jgi:two-component system response regulator YesN